MKKINLFIISMFLFITFIHASGNYVGTCTCYDATAGISKDYSCADFPNLSDDYNMYKEDYYGGVCGYICQSSVTLGYWYGRNDMDINIMISNCVKNGKCKSVSSTTKSDCVLNSRSNIVTEDEKCNKVLSEKECKKQNFTWNSTKKCCDITIKRTDLEPEESFSQCKYNYSKAACASIENGTWNESTNCCDLKSICWLHLADGSEANGGKLYWQEVSPCTDENNKKKYPSQKCQIKALSQDQCKTTDKNVTSGEISETESKNRTGSSPSVVNPDFGRKQTCEELLGPNLTKVVKAGIRLIQIAGAIIAIVNGMITLIPAVLAKDADGLKKASKKLVMMAIILAIIFLFPTVINLIGKLFNFDISCII